MLRVQEVTKNANENKETNAGTTNHFRVASTLTARLQRQASTTSDERSSAPLAPGHSYIIHYVQNAGKPTHRFIHTAGFFVYDQPRRHRPFRDRFRVFVVAGITTRRRTSNIWSITRTRSTGLSLRTRYGKDSYSGTKLFTIFTQYFSSQKTVLTPLPTK